MLVYSGPKILGHSDPITAIFSLKYEGKSSALSEVGAD